MKKWWKSRTLWFNAIIAVAAVAEANFSVLQSVLPTNAYGTLLFTLAIGNGILRFVTTQALGK